MMHVNVNCRDFERSRKFYELLGFKVLWHVPERNTPEVAAAVGTPPYPVRGALLQLEGSPQSPRSTCSSGRNRTTRRRSIAPVSRRNCADRAAHIRFGSRCASAKSARRRVYLGASAAG